MTEPINQRLYRLAERYHDAALATVLVFHDTSNEPSTQEQKDYLRAMSLMAFRKLMDAIPLDGGDNEDDDPADPERPEPGNIPPHPYIPSTSRGFSLTSGEQEAQITLSAGSGCGFPGCTYPQWHPIHQGQTISS